MTMQQSYHGIVFGDGPTQYNITLKQIAVEAVRKRITNRGGYLMMFGLPNPPRSPHVIEEVVPAAVVACKRPKQPDPTSQARPTNSKYVRCLNTGKIYPKVIDAANDLELTPGNISQNLLYPDRKQSVKGYKFSYATQAEYLEYQSSQPTNK